MAKLCYVKIEYSLFKSKLIYSAPNQSPYRLKYYFCDNSLWAEQCHTIFTVVI